MYALKSPINHSTGNVKYSLGSLWTFPSSVLVTGVLFKALHMVVIFAIRRTPKRGEGGCTP